MQKHLNVLLIAVTFILWALLNTAAVTVASEGKIDISPTINHAEKRLLVIKLKSEGARYSQKLNSLYEKVK